MNISPIKSLLARHNSQPRRSIFPACCLVLYKTGGGSDQAAVNITDGTSGWALYTVDLTTTETYAGGVVQVEFYHNTGKIWLDKVKLIGP